jgi:hypothetical protein
MKRQLVFVAAIALILTSGGASVAHHSFSATYEEGNMVRVEGSIIQVLFRNPHSFVQVEGKDGIRWGIEWGGATQLARGGVTRTTLKHGDQVVITGAPGRNPEDHRLLLRTLFRPADGLKWGERAGEVVE